MTIQTALDRLSSLLGDRFSRSKAELDQHSRSESHFPPIAPHAVVWPLETAEVAAIMGICAEERCPVIGWGAGTSLEGHGLAVRGGVAVDFTRMDRILQVNAEDMDVAVQPGVTREALNAHLRDTGLFFPVDPGANATLGGMAMTRASGTTAVRYGTMRDNVRAMEVVMADGTVIRTGNRARKSATGYDLTALMVGSEGTLGLVTELTLRLQGQPEAISAAVCAFDTLAAAVDAVTETVQMGIPMARIEFVDAATVVAVNAHSGLSLPATPHLMVEFHGSASAVAEQAARFAEIAADHGARSIDTATRPEDRNRLWQARHQAHWAVLAAHPGKRAVVTDVCVPISALAAAVTETQADIAASRLDGPILGHVGDGNFHAILLVDTDDPADMAAADDLTHRLSERALRHGGTVSGEHGVGMGKLRYMEAEHGAAWDVMGAVKRALDPHDLLNPGKLVRQT